MALEPLIVALCLAAEGGPDRSPGDVPLPSRPAIGPFKTPATPAQRPAPGKVTRVGVPEPNVVGDVSPRELAVLSQALVTEIRKLDGVAAIGVAEIRAMLTQEYRRQMFGCVADQSCLAEIAGALGVDELVSSQLVVDGGTSTLAVSRIDMRTTKVLANVQRRLARRNAGEEVLGAVGEVVATLYPGRALRPGETRGVARQVARWLNPPPLSRWVFFATAGAAVAAAAGGAAYGIASNSTRADYNALATGGGTVSGAELSRLDRQASRQRTSATLLFGLAGAFAVGAGVEALFTDWHDDRAAVRVGPAGATVEVRF